MLTTRVLIVGAGPAGSVCGYLLQKAGVDCLLIDRATFPRDKICGGGLTSKAWHLLEHLLPDFQYDFNAVHHVRLTVNERAHCEFSIDDPIRIVRRKVFDHQLLRQYQSAGGRFLQAALVTVEEQPDGTIEAVLRGGERVRCQYLIGADGSNSRVRHYLNPHTNRGILAMEQYIEKSGDNSIDVGLSQTYGDGGYYFRFPNAEHDVVGYGDTATTKETFRRVMEQKGHPAGTLRGAYVYLSNDYPLHERIILIGDAGGFANRLTCEGLYDAFRTAQNAAATVISGRPFRDTNAAVFQKMKNEARLTKFFFSSMGFAMVSMLCRYPSLVKWIFDAKMRRETWIKKSNQ